MMNEKSQKDKKEKRYLTMDQKLEIIKSHEKGESNVQLAARYDVHRSSICRIIKEKNAIERQYKDFSEAGGSTEKRQRLCSETVDSKFEASLYAWFDQQRRLGQIISGPLLRQKALKFHKEINGPSNFLASDGWLSRFKQRHGIRSVEAKGEQLSADTEGASVFKEGFNMFLEANGYDLDNVYNADETGLQYRELPKRTLATSNEKDVFGRKQVKQQVTVLVCANATGTHKIPLLVIGNSAKPRCFKNVQRLPVEYKSQKKAWMNCDLFLDWYKNSFLPEIKKRKPSNHERFVLILDNAPSHPSTEIFDAVDEKCSVFYLPPNVTSILQPMDQGVISSLKRKYRELYLRELVYQDISESSQVNKLIMNWSLLNCCDTLFLAWENVSQNTLRNAWKKLINTHESNQEPEREECEDLVHHRNQLAGEACYSKEDVEDFVHHDDCIPTWRQLSDEEILNLHADLELFVPDDEDETALLRENTQNESSLPTTVDAVKAFNTALQWCKSRNQNEMSLEEIKCIMKMKYKAMSLDARDKRSQN